MGSIGCPETSVTDYQSRLLNIPEGRISCQLFMTSFFPPCEIWDFVNLYRNGTADNNLYRNGTADNNLYRNGTADSNLYRNGTADSNLYRNGTADNNLCTEF